METVIYSNTFPVSVCVVSLSYRHGCMVAPGWLAGRDREWRLGLNVGKNVGPKKMYESVVAVALMEGRVPKVKTMGTFYLLFFSKKERRILRG